MAKARLSAAGGGGSDRPGSCETEAVELVSARPHPKIVVEPPYRVAPAQCEWGMLLMKVADLLCLGKVDCWDECSNCGD